MSLASSISSTNKIAGYVQPHQDIVPLILNFDGESRGQQQFLILSFIIETPYEKYS